MKYEGIVKRLTDINNQLKYCYEKIKILRQEGRDINKFLQVARHTEAVPSMLADLSKEVNILSQHMKEQYERWHLSGDWDWDLRDGPLPESKKYLEDIVEQLNTISQLLHSRSIEAVSKAKIDEYNDLVSSNKINSDSITKEIHHLLDIKSDLQTTKIHDCDELFIPGDDLVAIGKIIEWQPYDYILNDESSIEFNTEFELTESMDEEDYSAFHDLLSYKIYALESRLKREYPKYDFDFYDDVTDIQHEEYTDNYTASCSITIVITQKKEE